MHSVTLNIPFVACKVRIKFGCVLAYLFNLPGVKSLSLDIPSLSYSTCWTLNVYLIFLFLSLSLLSVTAFSLTHLPLILQLIILSLFNVIFLVSAEYVNVVPITDLYILTFVARLRCLLWEIYWLKPAILAAFITCSWTSLPNLPQLVRSNRTYLPFHFHHQFNLVIFYNSLETIWVGRYGHTLCFLYWYGKVYFIIRFSKYKAVFAIYLCFRLSLFAYIFACPTLL